MGKRTTDKLPSYRLHKASGQAIVTLSGKDHYLGVYGTPASRKEYRRLTGEWQANDRQLPPAPGVTLTVGEIMVRYYTHAKATMPGYSSNNVKSALRFLRPAYGHTPAAEFGPVALKAVLAAMVKADLSRGTINSYAKTIRRMFRWAAAEELLTADTWLRLRAVDGLRSGKSEAREAEPVLPVADALVDATLPHMPPVVADMVRVQRMTGMRPGEVCRMTAAEIDMSGKVWLYTLSRHKNAGRGKARVVAIGPKAQAILAPYLKRDLTAPLFSPRESEIRRGREGFGGAAYTPNSYRQAIQNAGLKAGLATWAPNQLRHTAATEIRRQYGLEGAAAVLGHSRLETSAVHYAERNRELAVRVAGETG